MPDPQAYVKNIAFGESVEQLVELANEAADRGHAVFPVTDPWSASPSTRYVSVQTFDIVIRPYP
jgi:hypothetical protein